MLAISQDEEHARLVLEAEKARDGEKQAYSPSMADWSPDSELLATLIDEVRGLRYVTVASNSKQKPPPPVPYPRPRTVLEKIKNQEREKRHRSLVARVLPHKSTK